MKVGWFLEAKPLYDNQLGQWIEDRLQAAKLKIDTKSIQIMAEALGKDLNKIDREIDKLKIVLDEKTQISPEHIEMYVGFSKDFNNFELYKAVAARDFYKCSKIIKYMSKTPKSTL